MKDSAAVAIGGFFGASLRCAIGLVIPAADGFPLGTLVINLLGSLFLAWFFAVTAARFKVPPYIRLGIGTGFTGAFTTFSAFSVETLGLIEQARFGLAAGYVAASVLGGIGLAAIGARLAVEKQHSRSK
ncbi:fluoride efflux transporter FluC [Brevibacillus sp. GCM10020057]|uniref:fluoride efflux transporter FluC n=1 Tax=Brevibacillus sp. GCM10020057 TaxID=3317327 RepID=UPI003625D283